MMMMMLMMMLCGETDATQQQNATTNIYKEQRQKCIQTQQLYSTSGMRMSNK
jgi:hypothetical protein